MNYCKFYKTKEEAENMMKINNKSLSKKCFHKYFKVVIDGPEDNFAVVDHKTAYEMGVAYSVQW